MHQFLILGAKVTDTDKTDAYGSKCEAHENNFLLEFNPRQFAIF